MRFHYTTVDSGEELFYQQLLLRFPFYDEVELLNNFTTYKEHFQSIFPQEYQELTTHIKRKSIIQYNMIIENYHQLIQQITSAFNINLQNIIS